MCLVKYAKSPANFYAERLYNTGKGIGTDEEGMTRIIVTRSEVSAGPANPPPPHNSPNPWDNRHTVIVYWLFPALGMIVVVIRIWAS